MATVNGLIDNHLIKDYKNLDPTIQRLINSSIEARKNAYSPYSQFPVGAAVLTSTGEIFTGCNIENSSFPASICAERVAISKAISEGHHKITACAVCAYKENTFVFPCGMCRQVLAEFTDPQNDMDIYLTKPSSTPLRVLCTTVKQIIPFIFRFNQHEQQQNNGSGGSREQHQHNNESLHLND